MTMRAFGLLLLVSLGCSQDDRNWRETIPLTGKVFVKGQPADGVTIRFHPEGGRDQERPTVTKAIADVDGNFAASTYKVGDGAPEGNYSLTFTWPDFDEESMLPKGDKFDGRFSDPDENKISVSVVSGSPVEMGTIELE